MIGYENLCFPLGLQISQHFSPRKRRQRQQSKSNHPQSNQMESGQANDAGYEKLDQGAENYMNPTGPGQHLSVPQQRPPHPQRNDKIESVEYEEVM